MDTIEQAIVAKLAGEGRRLRASVGRLASPKIGEGIRYEFDEVEVRYAGQFVGSPVNVKPDNWLAVLAEGNDKPIEVIYGVISFKKEGALLPFKEEFIKVSGDNQSDRFLMNSASYSYHEDTPTPKEVVNPAPVPTSSVLKFSNTEFSSHKKVEDSNVIKDFTPPIRLIFLRRAFDEHQELEGLVLSGLIVNRLEDANFHAWEPEGRNEYHGDLGTLIHAGDPTANSLQE